MNTKPTIKNFLVIILPALITVFVIFFIIMPKVRKNREGAEQIIGGDRDEHGCLGPAGYSWNEESSACLREWEIENEGSEQAIKIAVEYLGWQGNATVIEVVQARCIGCFVVKLENNSTRDRKTINLDNWQVKTSSLTPDECKELDGEPLNIVSGATCSEEEENLGEVTGFISPNICCVPIEDE
ncbi:hypothetical protein D4R87_01200 [bacterium]|nr:MAG: hypothetical protein D4R87_01200 [bacterium]